ncbi:hypothetical protein [Flavobacterium collinsii]|uniref:Uncharacterized protein n=1 Tax=Flavobacterium collinsii TaxID=1114861 RepID=A0ABN7ER63_9FLAO|nr:hypothetical protein [Flavobacterium collinsii]CAA9203270.1 hypothetical protein FLACOL7796_04669 [Flavobacterium collinsii]
MRDLKKIGYGKPQILDAEYYEFYYLIYKHTTMLTKKQEYIKLLRKLFLEGKISIELLEVLLICEKESLN